MDWRAHLVGGVLAFAGTYYFFPFPELIVPLFGITLFYSLLPDLDNDLSKINNIVEMALLAFVLCCLGGFWFLRQEWFLGLAGVAVLALLLIKFMHHRGKMHSLEAGVVLSLPLGIVQPVFVLFAFVGFASHLVVDSR